MSPSGIAGMPDPHNQAKSAQPGAPKYPQREHRKSSRVGAGRVPVGAARIDARSGAANHYRV